MDAAPQLPTVSQFLRSYAFRVGVYGIITFLVFHCTYLAIQAYGGAVMGAENGPIEMTQLTLAILAAASLFCAARWARIGRAGLVVCGAVVAYAAARESDLFLETYLFDDAYKWVFGLPLAVLAGGRGYRGPSPVGRRNDVAVPSPGRDTVRRCRHLPLFCLPILGSSWHVGWHQQPSGGESNECND